MLWLAALRDAWAGLVPPPISGRGRTVVLNRRGGVMYVRIVYTQQGSVEVLQVTGSLLILIIVCCCIVLCLRSYCEYLHVRELLPDPLFQLVCLIDNTQHTSGAMASGDSLPKADLCGISFRNQLLVPRNAPESIVTLDSLGVVVLDTSAVPDVIGLRARNNDAEPTRVLPGRAQNSVRVLIPDDRAAPWGFNDATLVDMAGATGPSVSKDELSSLRRQWPVSPVAGMSETD